MDTNSEDNCKSTNNYEHLESLLKNSKHVGINRDAARRFAESIHIEEMQHWSKASPLYRQRCKESPHYEYMSDWSLEEKIAFLFVFNSVSFCYWCDTSPSNEDHAKTKSKKWILYGENEEELKRGTWSMIAALHRSISEGSADIRDPSYLSCLSENGARLVFRQNFYPHLRKYGIYDYGVEIPLLRERMMILREIGTVVSDRYNCSFFECFTKLAEEAGYSVPNIARRIVEEFPSFYDTSSYEVEEKGRIEIKEIAFNKRAQLLVSDIYQILGQKTLGFEIKDIDRLTACADYILPMVLRYHGVLEYSAELSGKVDSSHQIPKDSVEEIEIRGNTLLAVELIKKEMQRRACYEGETNKVQSATTAAATIIITSMMINDYIWLMADKIPEECKHHLTRTTAY